MLAQIALWGALSTSVCPATTIQNLTDTWNKQDQTTYEGAIKRCGQLYPESPCLKLFRKKDATTYNAICGSR